MRFSVVVLALALSEAGGATPVQTQAQSATSLDNAQEKPVVVIHDAPIDVSDVKFIAFAPQNRTSGRLAISQFVAVK